MEFTLKLEAGKSFWLEAEPMMREHSKEVEGKMKTRKGSFQLDEERIELLEQAGVLLTLVARDSAGKLAGYCIWYLGVDLECKGVTTASQGPWFVTAEHRGTSLGPRLMRQSLKELRSRGVMNALLHHWYGGAGERLAGLFARLGAEPMEVVWSAWLD